MSSFEEFSLNHNASLLRSQHNDLDETMNDNYGNYYWAPQAEPMTQQNSELHDRYGSMNRQPFNEPGEKSYSINRSHSIRSSTPLNNVKIFQRRVNSRKLESKNSHHSFMKTMGNSMKPNMDFRNSLKMSNSGTKFVNKNSMNSNERYSNGTHLKRKLSAEILVTPSKEYLQYPRAEYITTNLAETLDVPLCVQETGDGSLFPNHTMMPLHALRQDRYIMEHYIPHDLSNDCKFNPMKILQLLQVILKFMFRTMKMVVIKIRKELDTREIIIDPNYRIPSLPNMDIPCNVCEKTEDERILHQNAGDDSLKYFEEPHVAPKFVKNMWRVLNDWMDSDVKDPIIIATGVRAKEPDVVYKVGSFPKDQNGKVELPTFESVSKK